MLTSSWGASHSMTSGTPIETGRHPHEEAISAYLDGELAPAERRRLEAHLSACADCQRTLRGYQLLGDALRTEAAPVPARLPLDLHARLRGKPARRRSPLLPAVGSLAAGLVFLFLVGSLTSTWSGTAVANAYPVPNATDVPLTAVVEIAYAGGVDKQAAELAVVIDPPVPVEKEWRGDTLVVKPMQPLAPETRYTVRALASARNAPPLPVAPLPVLTQSTDPTATPGVVTTFRTVPVAVAAAPSEAAAAATPTAAAPAIALASPAPQPAMARPSAQPPAPTPTPMPEETALAVAVADATPIREPVRGFGLLYKGNAAVRAGLGHPLADEQAVKLTEAVFEGGTVLWRGDERIFYVLAADGKWRSLPATPPTPTATRTAEQLQETVVTLQATARVGQLHEAARKALGKEMEAERAFSGAVQPFARGTMIWSDKRTIYVLYVDGRWERHDDRFVEETPTPTPTDTPSPQTTPTATPAAAAPAEEPTPVAGTATPSACTLTPVRGFGLLYSTNQELRTELACALEAERAIPAAEQAFEGGRMLWRGDKHIIYVLTDQGVWFAYEDTYQAAEQLGVEAPPSDLLAPERGFGKVWRERPEVRQTLGWATEPERGFTGAAQAFGGGALIWSDRKEIFVLHADGRWEVFADEFVE